MPKVVKPAPDPIAELVARVKFLELQVAQLKRGLAASLNSTGVVTGSLYDGNAAV